MPWATMTHTVPRRLHSMQTLCARIARACGRSGSAVITSSSWCLLIGQPRSSKSTGTWSLIGVEVASVEMYSGEAYTTARELLDVGEVAQRLDAAGGGARADRDQRPRAGADLADPLRVVRAW